VTEELGECQRKVHELIEEFGGYWGPFEMLAAITEELGEVADELLKLEGVKGEGSVPRLREELGDLIFSISCLANYYGINLTEALEDSIDKYRKRDLNRWGE